MEIKRIIGLCKKSGVLHLIENEGVQWLSDGYSMYPLFDLPRFDEETICRTYDISEKKAAKMTIRYDLEAPAAFDLSDDVPDECLLPKLECGCLRMGVSGCFVHES